MRQRKSCLSSSLVGLPNDVMRTPAGLTSPTTCSTAPSLPLVSIPWSSRTTRRVPPALPSAYNRSCRAASLGASLAMSRAARLLLFTPGVAPVPFSPTDTEMAAGSSRRRLRTFMPQCCSCCPSPGGQQDNSGQCDDDAGPLPADEPLVQQQHG